MRPMVRVVVATCVWMGATSFLAAVEWWAPELLLHGNPIGIRCVLGMAGAALSLPVGGWLHQLYTTCKMKMSAERLVNVWVGVMPPLMISHVVCSGFAATQWWLGTTPSSMKGLISGTWAMIPPILAILVVCALGSDSRGILRRCWPSLHHTIDIVRGALAPAKEQVPDLRFLTRHQIAALAQTGVLEGTWVVHTQTAARLRRWSQCGPPRIRQRAQRTLATLNDLQKTCPTRLVLRASHYPAGWDYTRAMIAEAYRPGTRLLLSNPNVRAMSSLPPQSLLLPTCVRALRSPYRVGDSLELPVLRLGERQGQAQGTLEDGTLVFISQGARHVGCTIRVEVVHVLHSVTGVLVFASAYE